MARRKKKRRTHVRPSETPLPNAPIIPHSFVIKSGKVGKSVSGLVRDIRRVMEPNTATKLRERKRNKLKDFVAMTGPLGVTHILIFTQTETGTNLRIARCQRGPTLCFRVTKYALISDVLHEQKHAKSPGTEYLTSPLLVLNGFDGEDKQMKLMTTMFQNMFPPINVKTMNLSEARRVVLLNYNSDTNLIDFRHYSIGVKPIGVSKKLKKITANEVPDLHEYNDISEYILRKGMSESEAESEAETSAVTLSQNYLGRSNPKSSQRAIKLTEIGPRMELRLVKIQAEMCDGEILFHHQGMS
ncbi:4691_t:CDS:2 [Paraglomus brasilianum]|uniref:4691_t:CDS:1 n=1 Tax=Paraglomus brasilianum TaxID=144538 RepID=A0A9N9CLC6_9GLOM|nr:4691_t:CDS:2 [Paraglomus brasilianum]